MGWAKSETQEGKNKAEAKIKAFKQKMKEARVKDRNKIAENLTTEVDKK